MATPANVEMSLRCLVDSRKQLTRRGIAARFITYDDLLLGRAPEVPTQRMVVMLFFMSSGVTAMRILKAPFQVVPQREDVAEAIFPKVKIRKNRFI